MIEEWKGVPGYDDAYQVSDLGRVRSIDHLVFNGQGHFVRRGRVLRTQLSKPKQYVIVNLRNRNIPVHRLVLLAFVGEPAAGDEARHLNGNNQDNALSNLAWGSRAENALDMVRHGTHVQTRKTHCPQGHPYDEENTYRRGSRRSCLTCKRAAWHRWNQNRKAAA